MKKILYVWIAVAVLLVGGLTFIGFNIKKQDKPYTDYEKKTSICSPKLYGTVHKRNAIK